MIKPVTYLLAITASMTAFATSAMAQVVVYTDQAAFNAATTNNSSYGFDFKTFEFYGKTYFKGPVTFFSSDTLIGRPNGIAYGVPYLADDDIDRGPIGFKITSTTSALGLFLGSDGGDATYTYYNDSNPYNVAIAGRNNTTFFGITNSNGPASIYFTIPGGVGATSELDVVSFVAGSAAAVPELATWAMMMLGLGAVGYALRRRRRASLTPRSPRIGGDAACDDLA